MSKIYTYKTIPKVALGSYSELGSKFLAFAQPLSDFNEIKILKDSLKKEHHKAVHVVYGCRIGKEEIIEKSSDDGEPAGTAGRPVLNELKSRELTQIIISVVRYYGGKKLGVPGLINAYKTAAADALNNSQILTLALKERYFITCNEHDIHLIINELNKLGVRIYDLEYGKICNFRIDFERAKNEKILPKLKSLWQIQMEHIPSE